MRAYLELTRLPNLPSALGNICLGALSAGTLSQSWPSFLTALLASAFLYSSGMAWNDYFDATLDQRERPERPIPSGRISRRNAMLFAAILMLLGILSVLAIEWMQGFRGISLGIAGALAATILLYDGGGKHLPLGPILMGGCRSLNVLLGWSAVRADLPEAAWWQAAVVGVYVCGVTLFAREEHTTSSRGVLGIGIAIILSTFVLALVAPAYSNRTDFTPWLYPYLVVGLGILIAKPLLKAMQTPSADMVQAGVISCLKKMIWLDAVLAAGFAGYQGFWILTLLIPGWMLGRIRNLKST